jgi:hypothetical protein
MTRFPGERPPRARPGWQRQQTAQWTAIFLAGGDREKEKARGRLPLAVAPLPSVTPVNPKSAFLGDPHHVTCG